MSQKRVNNSVLASAERRLIDAILPSLPSWMSPDILTGIGTFGAFVVLIGYAASNYSAAWLWLANFGLCLHWFGDSLDGNLARYRRTERPRYGYFLDQTIDVIGNFMICFGLGLSPFVDMRVALCALAGYHMVSIYVFVRANITNDFHVSVFSAGPTEIRLALLGMNIFLLLFGTWSYSIAGFDIFWPDIATGLWSFGFMVSFIYLVFNFAPKLKAIDDAERDNKP